MHLTRSYQLQISPNFHKLEDLRYNASRYSLYLQHFVTQLYYISKKFLSTKGMGILANQAQKEAMGIISAERETTKTREGNKSNCPQIKYDSCPAKIEESNSTSYDYWIRLVSQWKNKILIPAKSHRKLNDKLRTGWFLSAHCKFFKAKNDKWYVRVFVTKEVQKLEPKIKTLGVDVGITHGVCRSDNYKGKLLYNIIKEEKISQAERSRQKHKKKDFKTVLKQQLDIEVNRTLARCKRYSLNLAVENPKILANLKLRKLNRWARSYFANRAITKAPELGVYVAKVNPAYTSIQCNRCKHIDKQSRVDRDTFKCVKCGYTEHADVNASINIALKGQEKVNKYYLLDKAPVNTLKEEV